MRIECNYWSATCYCRDPQDLERLFALCEAARGRRSFAAINVFSVSLQERDGKPTKPDFMQDAYVWFPHCEEKEICTLLRMADIPLESVSIEIIPFEPCRIGKESSVENRKRRLDPL